jgi:hypothetical protein
LLCRNNSRENHNIHLSTQALIAIWASKKLASRATITGIGRNAGTTFPAVIDVSTAFWQAGLNSEFTGIGDLLARGFLMRFGFNNPSQNRLGLLLENLKINVNVC